MPRPRFGGRVLDVQLTQQYRRYGYPNPGVAAGMDRRVGEQRNVKPNPSYGGHQMPDARIPNYPTGGGTSKKAFNFLVSDDM